MATPIFLEPGWAIGRRSDSMTAAAAQHIGAQLPIVASATTTMRQPMSPRWTGSSATNAMNAMEVVENDRKASSSANGNEANGQTLLRCSFKGCDKVFKKSCKLIDHERTHTGERPFACQQEGCDKRFGRKDHLQRHMRSHASTEGDDWQNARPFECSVLTSNHAICGKRFLTRQHLNRHVREFHDQATSCDESAKTHTKSTPRPATYACTIGNCEKTFAKRKLLRSHINVFHSDKGKAADEMALDPDEAEHIARLPFPCTQDGCDRRFATNSKRMAHVEQKHSTVPRYICPFDHSSDGTPDGIAQFFTWTELLAHQRQHHRPTCSVPTCKKVFKEQRSLRAHLMRCHGITANEQYLIEEDGSMTFDDVQSEHRPAHSRNGVARRATVPCSNESCDQLFTSRRASLRHMRKCRFSKGADGEEADVSDNGQTDNEWEDDGASENDDDFYRREGGAVPESSADRPKVHHRGQKRHRDVRSSKPVVTINILTGQQYDDQSSTKKRKIRGRVLSCPWAQICRLQDGGEEQEQEDVGTHDHQTCAFRFSRLYDVQRHLKGQHGVQLSQLDIRSLLHAEERLLLGVPRSGTQIAKEEQQKSSDDDDDLSPREQ